MSLVIPFRVLKDPLDPQVFPTSVAFKDPVKGSLAERDPQGVPVSGKVLSTLEGQLLNQKRLV